MADLLGMKLEAAEEFLKREKIPYEILCTEPAGRNKAEGEFRVIREKEQGHLLLLTVCKVPDRFLQTENPAD